MKGRWEERLAFYIFRLLLSVTKLAIDYRSRVVPTNTSDLLWYSSDIRRIIRRDIRGDQMQSVAFVEQVPGVVWQRPEPECHSTLHDALKVITHHTRETHQKKRLKTL